MHAIRHELLPASGVEHACGLRLTPATLVPRHVIAARALYNVVVARSNLLRVFEVRADASPLAPDAADGRESVRRGTEAVEGEVAMDEGGEGFMHIGGGKSGGPPARMRARFHLIREHRLHGTVTGLERVRTLASIDDSLDRLLVSFKDAKIALLEWSEETCDLLTVSLHTYERAPQLLSLDAPLHRPQLRVDPLSRLSALSLPQDALAIIPFHTTQTDFDLDLDMAEESAARFRDIPYAPSFILSLTGEVDPRLRNVIDFAFLGGFSHPTLAVLCQPEQTWTARLAERSDTCVLLLFGMHTTTAPRSYPVIFAAEGLPYDCLSLVACPPSVGGVLVLAAGSLIHVTSSSRRLVVPTTGWSARIADPAQAAQPVPLPASLAALPGGLDLTGAHCAFVSGDAAILVAVDGSARPLRARMDGALLASLELGAPIAHTGPPALLRRLDVGAGSVEEGVLEHLFLGSTAGDSLLLDVEYVEEAAAPTTNGVDHGTGATLATKVEDAMQLDDDDDDIYGDSKPSAIVPAAASAPTAAARTALKLSLSDHLPAWGPISDMAFSIAKLPAPEATQDKFVPELVCATGSGPQAGFTLFQRDLPTRVKRRLHALGGARGIWALSVRAPGAGKAQDPLRPTWDTVVLSTDLNPVPGLSRVATRGGQGDIVFPSRVAGTTIGCGAFFAATAILHVMSNAVRVLEPDGAERQIIKDVDGNAPRAKIRACSVCDPYVLIVREDDTLGMFVATDTKKIRRKDVTPMGDKELSRYLAGSFFTDSTGAFKTHQLASNGTDGAPATISMQSAVDAKGSHWLVLVRPQGVLEIWSLPKLTLVFTTALAASLHPVLTDSLELKALSLPQDPPRERQDNDVDQVLFAPLGETDPEPHLFVFLRSGRLAIYDMHSVPVPAGGAASGRVSALLAKFVLRAVDAVDVQRGEPAADTTKLTGPLALAEAKRAQYLLVPFVTSPMPGHTLAGVFLTGDHPRWVLATDRAGVRIHPAVHQVVHAFTPCSLWENVGEFLMHTDEGPCLVEWTSGIDVGTPLPSRRVQKERMYSDVVYEPSTGLLIASATLKAPFASYDEDANIMWEPEGPNIAWPTADSSTLELITSDTFITMDGHEFAQNEFITAVELVLLETQSNENGYKEFIAVATTTNRGEDLAVKGAVYIYDIVEVVPDANAGLQRAYKLRLICRDDAKGPITALCGINGYLVSSMGQKVYVRALDMDERLVGVAFLDVGVHVTSLRTMKNLLVIGDAVKSIWFVAFQEDPYKLVVLAKDVSKRAVTKADLFFNSKDMSIISGDEDGVIRLYAYDPQDPESKAGQELLCRSEFHGQVECRTTLTIARRGTDDVVLPESKLLMGAVDGSLSALTPVDDSAFKRLQLLQGQLIGKVQHTAGLNPRAFRIVRNDRVSRALAKGILDANLLQVFMSLPLPRQEELARQIGTTKDAIIRDWVGLQGTW